MPWEHKDPADHPADRHYAADGTWRCFTCRESVRLVDGLPGPASPGMASIMSLQPAHAIKLASLAVHAEEYLATRHVNPPAAEFDAGAIAGLLRDPDVRAVLDDPQNAVLLPAKRHGPMEVAGG